MPTDESSTDAARAPLVLLARRQHLPSHDLQIV